MAESTTETNVALVTGASSGIGTELARIHAAKGGDLVLVARNEARLEELEDELESEHGVAVTVIAKDLSRPHSAREVFDATEAMGIQVDVLMNNAGFGGHGMFHERALADEQAMIQLNVVTLTDFAHLYLQGMLSRQRGKVLNVSSTASFLPGPLQAVYYATKAYVTSFSQAVAHEVADRGVTVTALCPGAVDTGFAERGNLERVRAFKNAATAESVARCGYEAMEKGELVVVNQRGLSFLLNWVVPFMPRKVVLSLSQRAMEKT